MSRGWGPPGPVPLRKCLHTPVNPTERLRVSQAEVGGSGPVMHRVTSGRAYTPRIDYTRASTLAAPRGRAHSTRVLCSYVTVTPRVWTGSRRQLPTSHPGSHPGASPEPQPAGFHLSRAPG